MLAASVAESPAETAAEEDDDAAPPQAPPTAAELTSVTGADFLPLANALVSTLGRYSVDLLVSLYLDLTFFKRF
jgi:hypothetical protein